MRFKNILQEDASLLLLELSVFPSAAIELYASKIHIVASTLSWQHEVCACELWVICVLSVSVSTTVSVSVSVICTCVCMCLTRSISVFAHTSASASASVFTYASMSCVCVCVYVQCLHGRQSRKTPQLWSETHATPTYIECYIRTMGLQWYMWHDSFMYATWFIHAHTRVECTISNVDCEDIGRSCCRYFLVFLSILLLPFTSPCSNICVYIYIYIHIYMCVCVCELFCFFF